MTGFLQTRDYRQRRRIIQQARHRGSMPSDVHAAVQHAVKQNRLRVIRDEVTEAWVEDGNILLRSAGQETFTCGSVVLATGFYADPPGMDWLKPVIEEEGLCCGDCGYPIVSPKTLEWAPGLHVTGTLAELELGPVARNIAGARRGAERIIQAH